MFYSYDTTQYEYSTIFLRYTYDYTHISTCIANNIQVQP